MPENIFLSIIIPAFNEAKRIGPTLTAILHYLKNKDFSYEIIVVNDGSTDDTTFVVKKFENIIILENKVNRGKGYSVKRGMLEARGVYRLFMDADNSVTIDNFDHFLTYFKQGFDIVIGSIEVPGAMMRDNNQWYRRFLGKISKSLIRWVATPGIYDTQRGFKLFTREAVEYVFARQTIDRWGFDIELVVIAKKGNLRIKEMPVQWKNGEDSSVRLSSYPKTLLELIKIRYNILKGIYG